MSALEGLSSTEAARLLEQLGPNDFARQDTGSVWRTLVGQLKGTMFWLLLAAAIVSSLIGEQLDAAAIAAILLINVVVGFVQEFRAEKSIHALRALAAPHARVLRDGHVVDIEAVKVVPGDLLVLEAGDVIAADAALVEAHQLQTSEAILTGESTAVAKSLTPKPDPVFMGTSVMTGTARARVTATGPRTEMGKIAGLLAGAEEPATPLQKQLDKVGKLLVLACIGIVALVAALGLWRGDKWSEVALTAISLAVAAVPEGLATIVTVALAVGIRRMAKRHVIVRHLHAVETLGAATVICTDKTGTLTTGVMALRQTHGADEKALLYAAAAVCDAEYSQDPARPSTGDSTELAILAAAAKQGIVREQLEQATPRVETVPFDSERKFMAISRADGKVYFKGAVDVLASRFSNRPADLDAQNEALTTAGLRVLAVATGTQGLEGPLEYVGLLGLADPPRAEAIAAVASARGAGIRTVMITGDHEGTARAIAKELGILEGEAPGRPVVYARATAGDKLKIVRELKAAGEVVAMTGDGVNDSPALREAHIGIAMGITGSQVSREAADMVLTDDNYASIVAAVEEGRGIFENIRKTLTYLLGGNLGELLVMFVAALIGMPVPLLPLQLLWINLVTDGLPSLMLVFDPAPTSALARPPRRAGASILGRREWLFIVAVGVLEATTALAVYAWAVSALGLAQARTMAFCVLVFSQTFRALSARDNEQIFWRTGIFTNRGLLWVVALTFALQLALVELEVTRTLFKLAPLTLAQLGLTVALGLLVVTVIELTKLVLAARRRHRPAPAAVDK